MGVAVITDADDVIMRQDAVRLIIVLFIVFLFIVVLITVVRFTIEISMTYLLVMTFSDFK